MSTDTIFETSASSIRFGTGVTREVGMDLADLGVRRAIVVTDPGLARLPQVATVLDSLAANRVDAVLYDSVAIEPTDESFRAAIEAGMRETHDALVAIGGGSAIDTAKAINLYVTCPPGDFYDYVNPPVGRGLPVPRALKPLVAIPTTAGTGSETTGVCVFDDTRLHAKTGISSRRLKPWLGLLDPDNTKTLPRTVAVSSGLDVLCHAVESYTALPYTERTRPERPSHRPAYQGANPVSDVWALEALRIMSRAFVRAVEESDDEARAQMLLAASYAGLGFGTAGVHLPHAMAYPVAGRVRTYRPEGYPPDRALVPHGLSVILNAAAVFRFTAAASPARHLEAAAALGADVAKRHPSDAGAILADRIVSFMQRLGVPNGLRAIGYTSSDIPALVEGTLLQQRITKLSPRAASAEDLSKLFEQSMTAW
ncbi:MAG TPA: hydroxyacid-oxoacid transhydrogenase [Vicinamibacterales bacterium]|nr:hydroxyacid-oxoacid transhydrogenase [Vicinamibacterales bacterium]